MQTLGAAFGKGLDKGIETAGDAKDALQDVKDANTEEGQAQLEEKKKAEEQEKRKKNPLKRGDYVVQVHLVETRDLGDKDKMYDPVCSVEVMGKKQHSSIPEKSTRSSWFDEIKVFQFADVTVDELERAKILVSVWDSRLARSNLLIGCMELDLSFVYYSEHHEVFRRWCALSNPRDSDKVGITGYVKLTVVVLGPGDEQCGHTDSDDEDDEGVNAVLMPPNVDQKPRALRMKVWRIENLPQTDLGITGGSCDPYLKVVFGGTKDKTKWLKNTRDGDFNEELNLRVMEPVMAKSITVQVLDHDTMSKDDLISTFFMDYDVACKNQWGHPQWHCLYGANDVDGGRILKKMNQGFIEGVAYRGRVLLETICTDEKDEEANKDLGPCNMPSNMEYAIQFDLYEGSELPVSITKETFRVELVIGPFVWESHSCYCNEKGHKGIGKWYQVYEKNILLPADPKQCPDVFVYLSDKKGLKSLVSSDRWRRICYWRMPFESFLQKNGWTAGPTWLNLRECEDIDPLEDDEFPGTLLVALRGGPSVSKPATLPDQCRPLLSGFVMPKTPRAEEIKEPPPMLSSGSSNALLPPVEEKKAPQPPPSPSGGPTPAPPPRTITAVGTLVITVVSAKNLPGLDKPGLLSKGPATSDPFVELSIDGGTAKKTKVLDKNLNPSWNESFEYKDMQFDKGKKLKVEVLDHDVGTTNDSMGFIGWTLDELLALAKQRDQGKTIRDSAGRDAQSFAYQFEGPFNPSKYPQATVLLRFEFQCLYSGVEADTARTAAAMEKQKSALGAKLLDGLGGAAKAVVSAGDKVGSALKDVGEKAVNVASNVATSLPKVGFGPDLSKLGMPTTRNYELRLHFYLARNLPAADPSGRSDPFVVVRCSGITQKSKIRRDTLNPSWYESYAVNLKLPHPLHLAPPIQICLFDWDRGSRNDPLGRMTVMPFEIEDAQLVPVNYTLEDWQGKPIPSAQFMACFQLFAEGKPREPMQSIKPPTKDMYVDVVTLGLRNLTSILGIHKTQLSFELPGEKTKRFMGAPSNEPSPKDPNFLQVLKIPVQLPVKFQFLPHLQLEVRDQMFGGLVNRLLGATPVDLRGYVEVDQKTDAWRPKEPKKQGSLAAIDLAARVEQVESKTAAGLAQARAEVKLAEDPKTKKEDKQPLFTGMSSDSPDPIPAGRPAEDYKHEGPPDEKVALASDFDDAKDAVVTFHAGETKDTPDPPEVPFYLKGRPEVKMELEQAEPSIAQVFETLAIKTGSVALQNNDKKNTRIVGTFKGLIRVSETKEAADMGVDLKDLLNPKDVYIRVYIMNGNVVPKDADGTSDPYLVLKLGKTKISTRDRKIKNTLNPDFFESFEIATTLPGASQLAIDVFDWDGIGDDYIGGTTIDLEDRWFSKAWRGYGLKPVERRSLRSPESQVDQGWIRMWIEILTPDQAKANALINIKPPPPEFYELRVIVWGVRDVPNMDEITDQNDLYVTCALAQPGTRNKKLKTDTHLRAKNGTGNFNWRFILPVQLPCKQYPRLKFAVWDMDFFSANDCIGEVVIGLKDLCKAAMKSKNEPVKFNAKSLPPPPTQYGPQWFVNMSTKLSKKKPGEEKKVEEKPSERFSLFLPEMKGKVGRIEVSLEMMHSSTAALLPAGTGRSDPNSNPFLPEPEGRLNLSLFHPCNFIREILGDKCTGKMLTCCCLIGVIALCAVMFPMIFSNVIGNLFTPR